VPVPQVFEHAPHAFQACAPATARRWGVQICVAESESHGLPPFATWVTTERQREWTPPPHTSSHVDQVPKPDRAQSTGQACSLQVRTSVSFSHRAPPWAAAVATDAVLVWVPEAQLAEQVDHAVNAVRAQSTGQA
jgi:hypothetical protein